MSSPTLHVVPLPPLPPRPPRPPEAAIEVERREQVLAMARGDGPETAAPDVVAARRRLSVLARRLGEPAMAAIGAALVDPASRAPFVYREGMFSAPPGMEAVGGDLLAAPLPVVW